MCALRVRSVGSPRSVLVSLNAVWVCVATLFDSSTALFLRITITDRPTPTVGGRHIFSCVDSTGYYKCAVLFSMLKIHETEAMYRSTQV